MKKNINMEELLERVITGTIEMVKDQTGEIVTREEVELHLVETGNDLTVELANLNSAGYAIESEDENCSCSEDQDTRFYQDHGCCEYCFYVG